MIRIPRPAREGALLILVLGVAALLRFKGLTFQSYWNDELFSAFVSDPVRPLGEVYELTVDDVHPPLYQSLLWWVYRTFGYLEVTGRALSAVLGTLGVLGIYLLGRAVLGSRVGLYSALIAALNAFLIYYSQEVRSYSLLFTLSTFSYLFFVRTLDAPRIGNLLGYALFTALALQTHRFGHCLAGSQAACLVGHLLLVKHHRRRLAVYALIAGGVLGLSLWPQVEYLVRDAGGREGWITSQALVGLPRYFYWYVESPALAGLFAVLLLLALRRMIPSGEAREPRERATMMLACAVLGYAVAVTISLTVSPVLSLKNTIAFLPPVIVVVAVGLDFLRRDALRRVVVALLVLLSAGHLFLEPGYYTTKTKRDWRSTAREIQLREPDVPLYGVWRSSQKLNVYFQWLGMELRARKINELRELMGVRRMPEIFWLLGPEQGGLAESGFLSVIRNAKLIELDWIEGGSPTAVLFRAPLRLTRG